MAANLPDAQASGQMYMWKGKQPHAAILLYIPAEMGVSAHCCEDFGEKGKKNEHGNRFGRTQAHSTRTHEETASRLTCALRTSNKIGMC